jgi:hypothetical protein
MMMTFGFSVSLVSPDVWQLLRNIRGSSNANGKFIPK